MKLNLDKQYRADLDLWEQKVLIGYLYTLWGYPRYYKRWRLFKYRKNSARYFVFKSLPDITIGTKELDDRYKGNKWLVPVNIIFDPKRP